MPDYAIRVELRGNPTYQQYETLHAVMRGLGFYQTINGVDSNGKQTAFNLPHAVYYGSLDASCGIVRDSVRAAVKAEVQENIIIFVVQALNWGLGW